jgi:hypothetical protein
MDFEDHGDSGRNYSCNDYVVMWMNQKMKTEEKLSICREGRMRINEEVCASLSNSSFLVFMLIAL